MRQFIQKHALIVFFILAYGLTWALMPLVRISLMVGLLGLLMPAAAAVIVTMLTEGRHGLADLFGRLVLWKVGLLWYAVALGLPVLASMLVGYLGMLSSGSTAVQVNPVTPLSLAVFLLVVGEELGWRGFALPRLLERFTGLQASLILGVLWALWHLPTFFIPGLPQSGVPLAAYVIYVCGLSVLFTWMYQHTRGSVLLATLFHGAIDTFGFTNPLLDPGLRWWLIAAVYAAIAVTAAWFTGSSLRAKTEEKGVIL